MPDPGQLRWAAEVALARTRRLRIRSDVSVDMHDRFIQLAHCMVLPGKLPPAEF